jgi:uncharacterized membrane protein
MKVVGLLLLKCSVATVVASIAIWWAYSINSQIAKGVVSSAAARRLTIELAGIICFLLLPVQVFPTVSWRKRSRLWIGTLTFGLALVVLFLYAAFVWEWREHWDISQGLSENAAFGPLVGHINAFFFAEFNGLAYVIAVAPIVAISVAIMTLVGSGREDPSEVEVVSAKTEN